jgi:urease accessory protein UreE
MTSALRSELVTVPAVGPAQRTRERRRSKRWATDETLAWRLHRGRRLRHGQVIERSLDGMTLAVETRDEPAVGARLRPSDTAECTRCGFQSAIVTRTGQGRDRLRLVYLEFEA